MILDAIDRMRQAKAVRALFAAVLALALSIPATGLSNIAQAFADTADVTVTIEVDGLASGTMPTLHSANDDFVVGQAINADPTNAEDASGNLIMEDIISSKAKVGQELYWVDEDGDEFDWAETKVTQSMTVYGKWKTATYTVTVALGYKGTSDEDLFEDVDVPYNKSYIDVKGSAPENPTREGYTFAGWYDMENDEQFDFGASIKENHVVQAKWTVADWDNVEIVDPTDTSEVNVPQTISGSCYIGNTWSVHPAHFSVKFTSGYLKGITAELLCTLRSAAQPAHKSAHYTATLASIDYNTGNITYNVNITPPGAAHEGGPRNSLGLIGYQTVGGKVTINRPLGGYLAVNKVSSNTDITDGNGCYSLKGAEYAIYDSNGTLKDTMTTDDKGYAKSKLLKPGKYNIVEVKPSPGFSNLDESEQQLRWTAQEVKAGQTNTLTCHETPQSDPAGVLLAKYDAETTYSDGGNNAMGNAKLNGAKYKVSYYAGYYDTVSEAEASGTLKRSWVYETDELGMFHLQHDAPISGDDVYKRNGTTVLPLGTVVIEEIEAPEGYNLPEPFGKPTSFIQKITGVGTSNFVYAYNTVKQDEDVYRADLTIEKGNNNTNEQMAGVPFKITSVTTKESHVIVTDANGKASTKASWNKHTYKTNANDDLIKKADGEETLLDAAGNALTGLANAVTGSTDRSKYGVWFGKYTYTDGTVEMTTANDDRGALPYDTYMIEELPCDANQGKTLIKTTVVVDRDSTFNTENNIDKTLIDTDITIGTTAVDGADGDKTVSADDEATIIDTVEYQGLSSSHKWTLKGTLMNKETGKAVTDADGNPVTATKEFTPANVNGTEQMTFTFDATSLDGADVVVFEELYVEGQDDAQAEEKDLTNEGQTVTIAKPKISTKAFDTQDGDKVVSADSTASVSDEVSYENLIVSDKVSYKLAGMLIDAETGLPALFGDTSELDEDEMDKFVSDLKEALGIDEDTALLKKAYTAYVDGEEFGKDKEVTVNSDGTKFSYTEDKVDSCLYKDEEGTWHYSVTDNNVIGDEEGSILGPATNTPLTADQVEVKETSEAQPLELDPKAQLDWEAVQKVFTDHEELVSHIAYATKDFKPVQSSATETMEFKNLDAGQLAGKKLVVVEMLVKDGKKVPATHIDLGSEEQTVTVEPPTIGTELVDKTDGDHNIIGSTETTVVDTVKYTGLIPGKEYTLTGTLMDKSTGKALKVNDKEITSTAKFTPNASEGEAQVEFTFDSTGIADGNKIVAFEECYKTGVETAVAEHKDIDDESQTVTKTTGSDEPGNPDGSTFAKTGADALLAYLVMVALALAAAGGSGYALRKRYLASKEDQAA